METVVIDTNILVRFLTKDDEAQWKRAHKLIDESFIVMLPSVILETMWVLENIYKVPKAKVALYLRGFCLQPKLLIKQREEVLLALDHFEEGFDFADAFHQACAEDLELKTFDRKFVNRAKRKGLRVSLP